MSFVTKNFKLFLWGSALVFLTACGNEEGQRSVTVTIPPIVSINVESNATSMNLGEHALLTVYRIYADGHTEEIIDNIVWEITPADSTEIKGNILTAKKDGQVNIKAKVDNLVSDTLMLNIYWEVNGHRLPPEPDKALNDSTLLGIDSNDNGVRDDVERKVYTTYKKAIERTVMMQAFRAKQKMLADPDMVKNVREWKNKITKYFLFAPTISWECIGEPAYENE